MRKMRLLFLLLAAFPLALLAKGEADDWQAAEEKGDVAAYDEYLKDYPDGAHAARARQAAAQKSAGELSRAAGSCAAVFPRAVYYAVGGTDQPTVSHSALASDLASASACTFSNSIDPEATPRNADGLLFARSRLELVPETSFPPRGIIDLDWILFDLEDAAVGYTFKKLVRCNDQSAWVDTSPKAAYECSKPYRAIQMRMAEGMASQAQTDFERISRVDDPDYRMSFWKKYQKLAKGEAMGEVAVAYKLHQRAMAVKPREQDPRIAEEIENAAIKLGGGKPTGGRPF